MVGKIGLTFKDSKEVPVHRWYPYVEGFSASWISDMLGEYCCEGMQVYDPFGGSGTMNLEASKRKMRSYFSEMNPFMRFILNTKINVVRQVQTNKSKYLEEMKTVINYVGSEEFMNVSQRDLTASKYLTMLEKKYFVEEDLKQLRTIYDLAEVGDYSDEVKRLIKCAAACITVDTSNMTRRADLRRRRDNEYLTRVVDVKNQFLFKWLQIINDINKCDILYESAYLVSDDARIINNDYLERFDFVITSPPYINGTNYIRNTSLELLLTEEAKSENDLKRLKCKTVCGGISDATTSRLEDMLQFSFVEEVACKLDQSAKDKRIPFMIRCYFSDMYKVLDSVYHYMKPGAKFALDIGDSKFYGVYIPTDSFLCILAEKIGFKVISVTQIAERFSRDKTKLKQVLIIFEKVRI